MKNSLQRLTEKTSNLGNYNRKYLHIISSNIEALSDALERQGTSDRVHLWSYSTDIPDEMETVLQAASSRDESLNFLGCFYALQFLHMNLRMIDIVKLELAESHHRARSCRKLMMEAGRMFRHLTKNYMEQLLHVFLEGDNPPEFVMLSVGTRADQDDIDLGIVHRRPQDSERLNRLISQLSSWMFKTATRLHFHLSEHIGVNNLTATLGEYQRVMDSNSYDFVIVSEMLGAAAVLGNQQLYIEFKKRITDRFYYTSEEKINLFHESYLRAMLGEIHSLLNTPRPSDTINPKQDGLREIKGILSALKLVYGVEKVNAWDIIDQLKVNNPERFRQYESIENTLSIFELFRHLYQIMVVQDETIALNEPFIEENVAKIARMMGFEKKGVVSSKDFLLVIYYESLENSVEAIEVLVADLKDHLRKVSIYKPIFSGEFHRLPGYKGNLSADFIDATSFAHGITYWDDFLEELNKADGVFYHEFISSFAQLSGKKKMDVAERYVSGIEREVSSVLRFLVTLGKNADSKEATNTFLTISKQFISKLSDIQGASASLAQLTNTYPDTLNTFLSMIDWESLSSFVQIAQRKPDLSELAPIHKQLLALARIHYQSSHFFKRHFHSILNKYPVFIKNLHNNDKLEEITRGIYSDITSLPSPIQRIERVSDYYDMEFVRVSLMAMNGASCEITDSEFIEFCDNYTMSLYEYCLFDLHTTLDSSIYPHDLLLLFATGGHAREQGFDDDYDLIVILDSTDEKKADFCNKLIARMNSHILKRGILPHHRFADHFGKYVINLDELADYLSSNRESIHVDQSQILSCRALVGTSKLENKFHKKIVEPFIFNQNLRYIDLMVDEMKSRHYMEHGKDSRNIKECSGGLRDIEMLMLIYKAKYKLRDTLNRSFLSRMARIEPQHGHEFKYIEAHLNFLKNMRDLYRLQVAANDIIEREYLSPVAATIGYGSGEKETKSLYNDFLRRTDEASSVINGLTDKIRD
jgi:hypothetical protein